MEVLRNIGRELYAMLHDARLAIETVAWAAMHRLRETTTNAIAGLTENSARETAAESFAVILATAAARGGDKGHQA